MTVRPADVPAGVRRVPLSDQRTLVIRLLDAGDIGGLTALYEGLDGEARYRRFFSMYRPRREFFEHMVAVADRGGGGIVAEIVEADGSRRIVAEAGFEKLPNGDGELAITVDAAWRGWLGPYLLDALIELAAASGVPNLEADLLVSNGPMLALLRSRGHVVVPHDDWTTLRVVIGTSGPVPTWPAQGSGLRVLIEGSGSEWRCRDDTVAAGLQVVACSGPLDRRHPCPALTGAGCPLAANADVIVVTDQSGTEQWHAVRSAHPGLHPGVPVCVKVHSGTTQRVPGEMPLPAASSTEVIGFVQRLATRHARRHETHNHEGTPTTEKEMTP